MQLKTSTVSGAESVRKAREIRGIGMTREEYVKQSVKQYKKEYKKGTGKKPTKKQLAKFESQAVVEFNTLNSEVWANYRKFLETLGKDTFYGSDELIDQTAHMTLNGVDEQTMMDTLQKTYEEKYEELQDIQNNYDSAAGIDLEGF